MKKLIEDNKERLIEVFSELFSEGEGEGKLILFFFGIKSSRKNDKILWEMYSGEQSKEWVEDNKESLIEVFSEVFSEKEGKGDSSKQYHQLKEWIKDNKESLTELFSEKEGKGDGEGKPLLACFWINSSRTNYKILWEMYSGEQSK